MADNYGQNADDSYGGDGQQQQFQSDQMSTDNMQGGNDGTQGAYNAPSYGSTDQGSDASNQTGAMNQDPSYGSDQTGGMSQDPNYGSDQTGATNQDSSYASDQTGATNQDPSYASDQTVGMNQDPSYGSDQTDMSSTGTGNPMKQKASGLMGKLAGKLGMSGKQSNDGTDMSPDTTETGEKKHSLF